METSRVRWMIRTVCVFLFCAAGAYYVWPTPYSYSSEKVLNRVVHIRTNRFTGETYVAMDLAGKGWRAGLANPFACRVAWQRLR